MSKSDLLKFRQSGFLDGFGNKIGQNYLPIRILNKIIEVFHKNSAVIQVVGRSCGKNFEILSKNCGAFLPFKSVKIL